jgi:hypothetical protein
MLRLWERRKARSLRRSHFPSSDDTQRASSCYIIKHIGKHPSS